MINRILLPYKHKLSGLGGKFFAVLLVLAFGLVLLYLFRRYNMEKAGVQPKPIMEDLGDVYRELQCRFDNRNFSGLIEQILGMGPIPAPA